MQATSSGLVHTAASDSCTPNGAAGCWSFMRLRLVTIAAATTRLCTPRCLQLLANLLDRITFQIDHDEGWFFQLLRDIIRMPVKGAIGRKITRVEVLREILVEPFRRKKQSH